MADDVSQLTAYAGPDNFYDPAFMTVLEDHMTYLRTHPKTYATPVKPIQASRYRFDLRGLMVELKIPAQFHYVVMRMNQFTSFQNVPEDLSQLLIPDETEINSLSSVSRARKLIRG